MSEANDGGPAFPHDAHLTIHGEHIHDAVEGMSLRDWFAGQALIGMCAGGWRPNPGSELPLAEDCYRVAAAMLAARKEQKP